MNRRSVLRGLAAFPIATALAGCHRDGRTDDDRHPEGKPTPTRPSGVRKLRVILMGPFAVVQQKDRNYRIKAYVPYDDEGKHEFRFPSPLVQENKHKTYQFKLLEESLETSNQPYIDRGFDGFNVELPEWKPPSDSFVSLDLPAPRVISYIPPAEAVQFERSPEYPQGQFTSLPVNHVLEYGLKDNCKVVLHSEQLGDCIPLSCDDLHQQYMRLRKEMDVSPQLPMDQLLTRCSQSDTCTFFLGVGLKPRPGGASYPDDDVHALNFFNNRLLPSLYGAKIPQGKRIVKLNVPPCTPSTEVMMSPMFMPAVQRLPFPQARYMPAYYASTENCTAPGATATSGRTL